MKRIIFQKGWCGAFPVLTFQSQDDPDSVVGLCEDGVFQFHYRIGETGFVLAEDIIKACVKDVDRKE